MDNTLEKNAEWKPIPLFGLKLLATDYLVIFTILFFNLLTLLFSFKIANWETSFLKNSLALLIYIGFQIIIQRINHKIIKLILRLFSVQMVFAFLFDSVHSLQLILFNWQDPVIINIESAIFGTQPTVWLQRFISPFLTEWMMFSYVVYIPIYPMLAFLIYFKHGNRHMEVYLFALAITNIVCDLGFILFPIASPMYFIKDLYTVPLEGYWFTAIGEYIRANLHHAGGSLPSPHCAIATIMWGMMYRYHRKLFYWLGPVIVSLYISTFYGRYHYLSDSVVGISVALIILFYLSPLELRWNRFAERIRIRRERKKGMDGPIEGESKV